MKNKFFPAAAILFGLAFIAGCSSTSEVKDEPPEQQAAPEPTAVQEPAQEPVKAEPEPEIALETTFFFDYDDANVRPGDRPALEALAKHINANPKVIRIEGHADERGTEAYNKELGQRRADAVRSLLVSMGVNSSQIETVSFGETKPIALGSGEAVWQKNRCVELKNI